MALQEIVIMISMLRILKMRTTDEIMNPTLRNLKVIPLMDLKMIMIVIQMKLFKLMKILLQKEEIITWVLEDINEV